MTKVKICKICATENDPSAIECVGCMGDISGIRPMSKNELEAEKFKDYDWDKLRELARDVDENGKTALMQAVFTGDLDAMNALIKAGADVNAKDNDDLSVLLWAVGANEIEAIRILVNAGADIDAKFKGIATILSFAIRSKKANTATIKSLISAGANLDVKDGDGNTALISSILANADPEITMALLKAGADINVKNNSGKTPLMAAIYKYAEPDVVMAIINAGADINASDNDGRTALMEAAKNNYSQAIAYLLQAGADVNARTSEGFTPLIMGIMSETPNPALIRTLIQAGADANAPTYQGFSAIQMAEGTNKPAAILSALQDTHMPPHVPAQETTDKTIEAQELEKKELEQQIDKMNCYLNRNEEDLKSIDSQLRASRTELRECQQKHDHHVNFEKPRELEAEKRRIADANRGGMEGLQDKFSHLAGVMLRGMSPWYYRIEQLKKDIDNLETKKTSIIKNRAENKGHLDKYKIRLGHIEAQLEHTPIERGKAHQQVSATKSNLATVQNKEILKLCTDFVFLHRFLSELESFNNACSEIEKRAQNEERSILAAYQAEQEKSIRAIESKHKNAIDELINKKSAALGQYEAEIQALNEDSIEFRVALYDEIFDRKRTSSGNIEQLRDDLFDQEEAISEERDLAWDEYQVRCEEILEERTAQEEYDKKNISRSVMEQAAALQRYKRDKEARRRDTEKKIDDEIARFTEKFNPANIREQYARIYAEEPFAEDYQCKKDNPDSVRIATLQYDLSAMNLDEHAKNLLESYYPAFYRHGKLQVPFCVAFDESFNYSFEVSAANRAMFIDKARSLAMRLFMMIPPNKINFTFVDPITLGDTFSLFTNLVDVDDRTSKVINGQIWTAAADVEDRLRVLTSHISNVNQRCLQGRYKNIQEYNKSAGQNAEPYQVLMIMDFPAGLKEDSLRMLEQIISTGPKCGVYTMLFKTEEQINKITDGKILALIENIEAKTIRFASQGNELFFAGDSIQLSIPDSLSENELQLVIPKLKDGIKNADKMVIKFDERKEILPDETEWLTGNSSSELVIPLGIHGANNVQNLVFGNSAYHALIIGQTGSGKSSLLHTMIMSSLIRYSADELNIFLIDFKRGVEFKIYANHRLESFRAVAIESEREFGDSVLAFLDQEQSRRAELFRRENVDNIHAYRAKQDKDGKNFILPRILLIIDEFHVLFSGESDSTGKNASIHLEQIIKQGRAFGIHVILSSQTMASVGGIHQSLWGQVGIRIALKCPQADAKLILADDNDGVDLLSASEPGAAVYNSDCGNKTANTIFRVAYIEQEAQSELLEKISGKALKLAVEGHISRPQAHHESALTETRVMVSNIEDNLYHPYQTFINGGNPKEFEENAVLIGEPLQLSGKLRTGFKPKEASNMLIIGKDEQKARAMFTFSALSLAIHSLAVNGWQTPSSACLDIVNFVPPEYGDDALISLKDNISRYSNYCDFDGVADMLEKIHASLKNRSEKSESQYLLLFGLQRARNLRQGVEIPQSQKNFDDGLSLDIGPKPSPTPTHTPYQMFLNILREGPQKNIHTIAWIDNFKIFQEYYPGWLDEFFGLRVGFTMPNDDSLRFMEEPDGSKISESNAIFSYNGNQKFRPYKMPGSRWLEDICRRMQ